MTERTIQAYRPKVWNFNQSSAKSFNAGGKGITFTKMHLPKIRKNFYTFSKKQSSWENRIIQSKTLQPPACQLLRRAAGKSNSAQTQATTAINDVKTVVKLQHQLANARALSTGSCSATNLSSGFAHFATIAAAAAPAGG
ncbi:unnamed protein product [Ceratitis capitata]|uniref:(Mediterranean fruit fly) hypothetical protein n=1 Tax=Ceratitis capitata TaxID=7213 RepID=A0A811VCP3_CERCA|nr:unnamed protein product [Ceratitis capitata]